MSHESATRRDYDVHKFARPCTTSRDVVGVASVNLASICEQGFTELSEDVTLCAYLVEHIYLSDFYKKNHNCDDQKTVVISSSFCLGQDDFCCCEDCGDKLPSYFPLMSGKGQQKRKADKENVADDPAPSKKLRLSLRKGKDPVQPGQRFGEVTDEELAALSKGHVPANTEKCTVWAVGIYRQWRQSRGERGSGVPDVFEKPYDCDRISHCLSLFVAEARKSNGQKYPPKSLYQILCGLSRYMRKDDPSCPNFLNQHDS